MFSILSTTTKCRSWYIVHFRSTRNGKSFGRHIKHSPFNCFGRNWSSFSSICSRHTLKKVEPPKESIPQELNGQANSVESIKVELKKNSKVQKKTRAGKYLKLTQRNAENQEGSHETQLFPLKILRNFLRVSQIFQTKIKRLIQPIVDSWREDAHWGKQP